MNHSYLHDERISGNTKSPMFDLSGLRKTLMIVVGTSVWVLGLPAASFAQGSEQLQEIVVTGSRIRQDTFSSSSPLTTVDGQVIAKVGETNLGDFLERVPSITSGFNASSTAGNNPQDTGLNTTSLRNLGTSRTLVLVNGRRYVSGVSAGSGYGVDMNSIPTAIIDRIDVLTGNQSAVYGSDALAGVINIVTKTDFDGARLDVQIGQASEGDRERADITLTVGSNFGDSNNAWFSLGYADADAVRSRDRGFSSFSRSSLDTDGDGLRDTFGFEGSSFIPESRLLGAGLSIKGDGSPFEGSRNLATTDRLNFYDFATLRLPSVRRLANAGLNLNFGEKTSATLELNYARVDSDSQFEPLPLNTVQETFRVNRGGTSNIDLATHPLWAGSSAGAQFLAAGAVSLDDIGNTFRRVVEFGQLGAANVRTTFRVAGALDHVFDNGMRFELSGTYGVTDQNQTNFGDINLERAATALDIEPDGNGGFQCVSAVARLAGCVPYNPFNTVDSVAGLAGVTGFSDAARDYLEARTGLLGTIEQTVVTAALDGDLAFSVGAQDNVSFAVGAEYREEKGEETPDGLRQKGLTRILTISPTKGNYNVAELFGELRIPLADKLTLDLAARFGDYSSVGNISSWRVGFDAPLSESVRLRGAASTAIRAPNVSDLFAGRINNATSLVDVCDGITAASTGNIADNCRSFTAIQDRITATGAFTLSQIESQQTRSFTAGSPLVQEEEATSFTFGAVLTPESWGAFSIAADFYSIEIEDAIRLASSDTVLNRCYDVAPGSFDQSCGGEVVRDLVNGPVFEIENVSNNEDTIKTSGIDLEATYFFENLGAGDLLIALGANFITEFEVTGLAGDVTDLKGEVLTPDFRFNLSFDYNLNDFNAFAQLRYRDATLDRNDRTVNNANLNEIDSAVYLDLRTSYRFGDTVSAFVGTTNVFDEDPPDMGFQHKYLDSAATNGTAFDVIGRQIYAGVNVTF